MLAAPRREFLHEKDEYLPRVLSYGDYGKTLDTMKEEWYRFGFPPLILLMLFGSYIPILFNTTATLHIGGAGLLWLCKRGVDWHNIKKTVKSVEDLDKKGLSRIMPYLKNKEINELHMLSQSHTPSESQWITKEHISRKAKKELRFKLLDEKFGHELI